MTKNVIMTKKTRVGAWLIALGSLMIGIDFLIEVFVGNYIDWQYWQDIGLYIGGSIITAVGFLLLASVNAKIIRILSFILGGCFIFQAFNGVFLYLERIEHLEFIRSSLIQAYNILHNTSNTLIMVFSIAFFLALFHKVSGTQKVFTIIAFAGAVLSALSNFFSVIFSSLSYSGTVYYDDGSIYYDYWDLCNSISSFVVFIMVLAAITAALSMISLALYKNKEEQ